jgi:hypothetical protein
MDINVFEDKKLLPKSPPDHNTIDFTEFIT